MIQLKNAVKIYGQGTAQTRALNGVNFQVARGEFVAVMGPSGSGKSTLLHIIGCLDGLTEGSFLLDGQELYGKKERELHKYRKKYISYVFQDFALMEDYTIQENIEFPLEIQNAGAPQKGRGDFKEIEDRRDCIEISVTMLWRTEAAGSDCACIYSRYTDFFSR